MIDFFKGLVCCCVENSLGDYGGNKDIGEEVVMFVYLGINDDLN